MKIIYIGSVEGYEASQEACRGRAEVEHIEATAGAVSAALTDADGLIDASMKVPLTDAMIEAAPKLRIISCATTGSDHIQRQQLDKRGIPVRTLREDPDLLKNITPAAELSWALLMALARKLTAAARHTSSGHWDREEFPGIMLNGRTLGIIGCGRIGQWMGRYAKAFGMRVIGTDPHIDPWPEHIEQVSLETLTQTADFLTVHVHLSDETRHLIDRQLFEALKPGAIFINTSRSGVADEAALLDALESGRLGGAGLDVLDGEPDTAGHPLVAYAESHDNLILTPHCGGFSPDAVRLVCAQAATKIIDHLEGPA
ncbi:MAG: hydroxyacid dehydrogenase [Rhodospirillales bacterium]|nr:hydroxyacid dehydrogenase [Rhodospirillales bacterium]